jgi:sugar phosphate isomerase/epimerase
MDFGARAYSLDDVRFLGETSFDFAELDWKDPHLLAGQLADLAALRERYGIAYLAHGPNERDPFDLDELAGVLGPTLIRLLNLAPELDISLYTQHLWLDPRFMDAGTIARKLDLLEGWLEAAARAGVALCIENLSEHADHFAPAFGRLPALGMTLDLGHGQILSRPNAAFAFIARFPDRVRHVHLHDNHGGTGVQDDVHLPIGQGRIDFPDILRALREAGYAAGLSLEVRRAHVAQGRDTVRAMWQA